MNWGFLTPGKCFVNLQEKLKALEDSTENYSSCRQHDVIRGGGRGEGTAPWGALTCYAHVLLQSQEWLTLPPNSLLKSLFLH